MIIIPKRRHFIRSTEDLILKKMDDIHHDLKEQYRSPNDSSNSREIRFSSLDTKIESMNQNLTKRLDVLVSDVSTLKTDVGGIKSYQDKMRDKSDKKTAQFRWRCSFCIGAAAVFLGAARLLFM